MNTEQLKNHKGDKVVVDKWSVPGSLRFFTHFRHNTRQSWAGINPKSCKR